MRLILKILISIPIVVILLLPSPIILIGLFAELLTYFMTAIFFYAFDDENISFKYHLKDAFK